MKLALRLCLAAAVAVSPTLSASVALAQTAADVERYGRPFIAAKEAYDKAMAAGRYRDAVQQGKQLVYYIQRLLPDRKDLIATQYQRLGRACSLGGMFDEAETALRKAIELRTEALGADDPAVAESLHTLSNVYSRQGRYGEAERAARRAVELREEHFGPDHDLVADSLNNLAAVYFHVGRYVDAEELFRRSLAIHERVFGPDHVEVANNVSNLATIYRNAGQFDEAIEYDQRALAIRRAKYGQKHARTAYSLNNLGLSYAAVGRYNEAVQLYEQALAIRKELLGPESPDTLVTMNNLAVAYGMQQRNEDALKLYQETYAAKRKVLGDEHLAVAIALSNLAVAYSEMGRHEEGLTARRKSQELFREILGDEHADFAFGLMSLGRQLERMGRHDDAAKHIQQASEIFEQVYGNEHPNVAAALDYMAQAHMAAEQYEQAAVLLERAIAIRDAIGVAPGLRSTNYFWRAQIKWKLGDLAGAEEDLEAAMRLAEQQRSNVAGGAAGRAKAFAQFRMAYERMIALQAELGNVASAFEAAERGRARSLADQLAAAHVDLLAGLPPAEAQRLNQRQRKAQLRVAQLERMLAALGQSNHANADPQMTREELTEQLAAARREAVLAYIAIRDASPAYQQIVGSDDRPATLDEIQRSLIGDNGLLLEYSLGALDSYVIVVPAVGSEATIHSLTIDPQQAETLGIEAGPLTSAALSRALINEENDGVLQMVRDPEAALEATDKLAALWQILIPAQLQASIQEDELDRLLISPDGVLNLLPFEALVVSTEDDPTYLLDVAPPVIYGPSASLLDNLSRDRREVRSDRKPVLTVGDPAYSSVAPAASAATDSATRYALFGGSLTPLPFSGYESSWVSEVFRKQGIDAGQLTGARATEARVRFNVSGRRVVHLACHGLADEQFANFYGALALAPGNRDTAGQTDDGFLTLAEIYELEMQGCELAILSACNTNYGPEMLGEGVWALSRGFLVAGARRVVASNWLVDDEAAASLVSVFCANLARSEAENESTNYAAALHAAKRWTRGQTKWRSPYYWATFVQLGPH